MAARYRNSVANCRVCVPEYATPDPIAAAKLLCINDLSAWAEVELARGATAQWRAIRHEIDDSH
jgi:hypothetical protein